MSNMKNIIVNVCIQTISFTAYFLKPIIVPPQHFFVKWTTAKRLSRSYCHQEQSCYIFLAHSNSENMKMLAGRHFWLEFFSNVQNNSMYINVLFFRTRTDLNDGLETFPVWASKVDFLGKYCMKFSQNWFWK